MKYFQVFKLITALFFFVLLASCGSEDGGITNSEDGGITNSEDGGITNAETGRVSLLITDGLTTEFDQINITLESISFLADDDEQEESDDEEESSDDVSSDSDDSEDKETIVFDEVRVINLLALQNYSDLLTTTSIPVGSYSKIRLHVSKVELVKLNPDGTVDSKLAKLPANGKIDLNPQGSFDVVAGEHLMIELDVDAEKSIHIVKTGNGQYIFRPVIFISVLGSEELKLVMLDGRVFEKTLTGFQLCDEDAVEVTDSCLEVVISDDSVIQNSEVDVIDVSGFENNNLVTVLGKANSQSVNALHLVISAPEGEVNNLALFTGQSDTEVNVTNAFDMTTDDDNDVVLPNTALSVEITSGARVFNEYGVEVGAASIVDGTDVDVFGLALPDLLTVTGVKAAFVIVDNDVEDKKASGAIVSIDLLESEITITVVSDPFSGDVCVEVDDAKLFVLTLDGITLGSEEILIGDLKVGMIVDVYGVDVYGEEEDDCNSAEVLLVTAS